MFDGKRIPSGEGFARSWLPIHSGFGRNVDVKITALILALLLGSAFSAVAYDPAKQPLPADPGTAYELGRVHIHNGDMERAFLHFRLAVAEDPEDFRAHTLMGYSLRHLGRLDEAISAYNRALAVNPVHAEAVEYRGVAHLLRGNRVAAMRDYQKLVALRSPLAEDLKKLIDESEK